ncbi:MAG: hypothetical protein J2O48_09350 [Solirubrobacterales bacterium]|nr:hypothetical protein [Solirubrobacterales bacterium]
MDDARNDPELEGRLLRGKGRFSGDHTPRWLTTRAVVALLVLAAASALAVFGPQSPVSSLAVILTVGLFLACARTAIPVGAMWLLATQLALVPMWVLLPPADVPLLVIACMTAEVLIPRGALKPGVGTLLTRINDSVFALGPALVLVLFGPAHPTWHAWPIYAAALLAQFAADSAGVAVTWLAEADRPMSLEEQVGSYLSDLGLTCLAIPVVAVASTTLGPTAVLFTLPHLGLLRLLNYHRRSRLDQSLELARVGRGTAQLIAEVVNEGHPGEQINAHVVAKLAPLVCDRLGLSPIARRRVELAALAQDVGKLGEPDKLSPEDTRFLEHERRVLRYEALKGQQRLQDAGGALADIAIVVRHAHEHYDGRGEPDGLKGSAIPIESSVLAACTSWVDMTSGWGPQPAFSDEVAIEYLRQNAGHQLDPAVAHALLEEVAPAAAAASNLGTALAQQRAKFALVRDRLLAGAIIRA